MSEKFIEAHMKTLEKIRQVIPQTVSQNFKANLTKFKKPHRQTQEMI
jgi:hypothetical protein